MKRPLSALQKTDRRLGIAEDKPPTDGPSVALRPARGRLVLNVQAYGL